MERYRVTLRVERVEVTIEDDFDISTEEVLDLEIEDVVARLDSLAEAERFVNWTNDLIQSYEPDWNNAVGWRHEEEM